MNVIDALFITLGLDTRDFEKKQKDVGTSLAKMGAASDKQTKLIAESGKKAAHSFSLLKVEVLGALAAFGMGAGFKSFIESSMNMQAGAGRTAEALGISVQSMRAYKLMAKEMGESGDVAVATLQKVSQGMAAARSGDTSFLTAGSQYGVVLKLNDNTEEVLSELNEKAYAIKQMYGGAQAAAFLSNYGISDTAQQTQLMENPAKYAAEHAAAMKSVGVWTQQEIERSQKLQKQWAFFIQRMENLKIKVFDKLEPILIRIGDAFAKWLDGVDWNKVINAIGRFIDKVQQVVKEMGGWKVVAEILGGVLALKLLSPLAGMLGLFGELVPLVGSLTSAFLVLAPAALGAAAAVAYVNGMKKMATSTDAWRPDAISQKEWDANELAYLQTDKGLIKDGKPFIGRSLFHKYDPKKFSSGGSNASNFAMLENSYGLPAGTLSRKFKIESNNGNNLTSKAGALGPMQFMPETAAGFGLGGNVMDLGASARAAASYLKNLHKQFGSWDKAEAAYNWGPGNLKKAIAAHGDQWLKYSPAETQRYVAMSRMATPYVGAKPGSSIAKAGSGPATNEVHINTINVQTKATDANGVAKGMQKAMRNNPLITGYVTAGS